MIEIRESSIESEDAVVLIEELNQFLTKITGDDGTIHFRDTDVEQERSVFLIGYIDGEPCACGALRQLAKDCAEIKRIYTRKNTLGMGHRILTALEEKAREYQYQQLFLETRDQNTHAIAFL
jgi:N-acetylglutamate synthase-like GNAT family acetyltransferase